MNFCHHKKLWLVRMFPLVCGLVALAILPARGEGNLLKNAGFEDGAGNRGAPSSWLGVGAGAAEIKLSGGGAKEGQKAVSVPARTAIEQRVAGAAAGAYEFRCWVKSEAD